MHCHLGNYLCAARDPQPRAADYDLRVAARGDDMDDGSLRVAIAQNACSDGTALQNSRRQNRIALFGRSAGVYGNCRNRRQPFERGQVRASLGTCGDSTRAGGVSPFAEKIAACRGEVTR